MAEVIRKVRRWGNEPTQTKKKWTVGVNLALAALYFGGGLGLYRYVENREADDRQEEQVDCLQRVDSRTEIRGMFLTTFDVIEETTGNVGAFDPVRVRLDERYPELSAEDCDLVTAG